MPDYTKWPTVSDVQLRLRSAGIVSRLESAEEVEYIQSALDGAAQQIRTLTGSLRQFPLDSAPSVLTYTPAGTRSIQIRDAVSVSSVAWQPYGVTSPQALVVDRDYTVEDAGAASAGRPYTVLEFGGWCGWGYGCSSLAFKNALKVTALWGWPSIPADLWRACRDLGCADLVADGIFTPEGRIKKDASGTAQTEYALPEAAALDLSGERTMKTILRYKRVTL